MPNVDTFLTLAKDFSVVKKLTDPVYRLLPFGPPVPDVNQKPVLAAPPAVPLESRSLVYTPISNSNTASTSNSLRSRRSRLKACQQANALPSAVALAATRLKKDIGHAVTNIAQVNAQMARAQSDPNSALQWLWYSAPSTVGQRSRIATLLANAHRHVERSVIVGEVLAEAAGIYAHGCAPDLAVVMQEYQDYHPDHDPDQYRRVQTSIDRMNKTVLVTVLDSSSNDGYRWRLLLNFLCFTKHYGHKIVVFVLDRNVTRWEESARELHRFNDNIRFVEYPYELFWDLMSSKTTAFDQSPGGLDFAGLVPTYKHFGFFIMLVPVLEVLEQGYHVVYLDTDMALVRDPFDPDLGMLQGNSDIVVSAEIRSCLFPSLIENAPRARGGRGQEQGQGHGQTRSAGATNSAQSSFTGSSSRSGRESRSGAGGKGDTGGGGGGGHMEPNTGTLYLRATEQVQRLVRNWLLRIVRDNVNNDQKVLRFNELGALQSWDCNPALATVRSDERQQHRTAALDQDEPTASRTLPPRFCFLNEMLFQVYCAIIIDLGLVLFGYHTRLWVGAVLLYSRIHLNLTCWRERLLFSFPMLNFILFIIVLFFLCICFRSR